jgi:hypothetical protein
MSEENGRVIFFRSQWPRGLMRWSSAAPFLILRVRIPPEAWISVSRECCVLSSVGLCDGLVPRLEESYWARVILDKVVGYSNWSHRTVNTYD